MIIPFPVTREALARLTRLAQLGSDPAKARALLALTDREALAEWEKEKAAK